MSSIDLATSHLNQFAQSKDKINYKNRELLGRSISVLKKNGLPDEFNKIDKAIEKYDIKLERKLNRFKDALTNKSEFYTYKKDNRIKVKTIDDKTNLIKKIIFKLNKILKHDNEVVKDLFSSGKAALENAENKKSIKKTINKSKKILEKLSKKQGSFYKTKKGIQNYLNITGALNAAIDASKHAKKDNKIEKKLLSKSRKIEKKNNTTDNRVQNLIASSIASTMAKPQKEGEESFLNLVGSGPQFTLLERNVLNEILSSSDTNFSPIERITLQQYVSDLDRSKDLNAMLRSAKGAADERVIAEKAWKTIDNLKEGESVILDLGYRYSPDKGKSWVWVRTEFQKKSGHVVIKLHDSSGSLQAFEKKKKGKFKSGHGFATLTTSATAEEFKKNGREYMQSLIAINCDRKEIKAGETTYLDFLRVFTSINPKYRLGNEIKLQKADLSYAQRTRAHEKDRFGHTLYKKTRVETLKQVYNDLLKECENKMIEEYQEELNEDLPRARDETDEKNLSSKRIDNLKKAKKRAKRAVNNLIDDLDNKANLLTEKELNESKKVLNQLQSMPSSRDDFYHCLRVLRYNIHKERSFVG